MLNIILKWIDVDRTNKRLAINKQLNRQHNFYQSERPSSTLTVSPPKTATSVRYVYLFDGLFTELTEYIEKRLQWKENNGFVHSENEFLFSNSNNQAIEPRRYYQYYKEILKNTGIENANFHTLRNTFATHCLESGIDIVIISKMLGHANARITVNIKNPYEQFKESNSLIMYAKGDSRDEKFLCCRHVYLLSKHRIYVATHCKIQIM